MVDDMDVSDLEDSPRRKTFEPPAPEDAFADSIPILDGVDPLENAVGDQPPSVMAQGFDSSSADLPSTDLPSTDLPSTDLPSTDLPSADAFGADSPRLVEPTPEVFGTSVAPEYLPPPVRKSLSEAEIFARFDNEASATTDLLIELERQVTLKMDDEEAFESWSEVIRQLRPQDAQAIIDHERIIFDGGVAGPLVLTPEVEEALPPIQPDVMEQQTSELVDILSEPPLAAGTDEPGTDEFSVDEHSTDERGDGVSETADELLQEIVADTPAATAASVEEFDDEDSTPVMPVNKERWPLAQTAVEPLDSDAVVANPSSVASPGTLALFFSWFVSVVPLVALSAGAYLVFRGLGVVEVAVGVASASVLTGLVIAQMARSAAKEPSRELSTQPAPSSVSGGVIAVILVAIRAIVSLALLWVAQAVVVNVVAASGLWTASSLLLSIMAGAFVGLVAIALALLGGRTLRVALFVSGGLGVLGMAALVVIAAPDLDSTLTMSWSSTAMPVLASVSLVLAGLLLMLGSLGGDQLRLSSSSTRATLAPGVISGLVSMVPLALMTLFFAWWAESSALTGLGLLADPIGTIVDGLPLWYPAPAILGLAMPMVGLASLVAYSSGSEVTRVGIPGSRLVHTVVVSVLIAAGLAALVVLEFDVSSILPDLVLTLGVVMAAWAGFVVIEGAMGTTGPDRPGARLTLAPVIAMLLGVSLGLGASSSSVAWLSWQGYLFPLAEQAGLSDLAPAQPGVLVALVSAALVSLIASAIALNKNRIAVEDA